MVLIRYVILMLIALQSLSYAAEFPQILTNSFDNKGLFYVITVTRDLVEDVNSKVATYEQHKTVKLESYKKLLDKLNSAIIDQLKSDESIKMAPIFIVFNEYFFSRNILTYDQYNGFVNEIKNFLQNKKNVIVYANFLYKQTGIIPQEQLEKAYNYGKVNTASFSPEYPSYTTTYELKERPNDPVIKNETSVFYLGETISRYRKSTYYQENNGTEQNLLYYFGFGLDELELGLNKIHEEIANILHQNVCTDICWDIQNDIRYKLYLISIGEFDKIKRNMQEYDSKNLQKLQQLIGQNYKDPHKFKLRIIQSNTTNIHTGGSILLGEGQIVVQSDPLAQMVFKIKKPEFTSQFTNLVLNNQLMNSQFSQQCSHYCSRKLENFILIEDNCDDTESNVKINFFKIVR